MGCVICGKAARPISEFSFSFITESDFDDLAAMDADAEPDDVFRAYFSTDVL